MLLRLEVMPFGVAKALEESWIYLLASFQLGKEPLKVAKIYLQYIAELQFLLVLVIIVLQTHLNYMFLEAALVYIGTLMDGINLKVS